MNKRGKTFKSLNAIFVIVALFSFYFFASNSNAGVPQILSFQGRLTDGSGNLLGGNGTNYYFKFNIYPSLTCGSSSWSSGGTAVTIKVTQGVFNTLLGDTSTGYDALDLDFDSANYYLEVQVDDDSGFGSSETLSPRQRIVASGFAINAETVHGGRFLNTSGVGQFGSLTTVSYSRFGTDTTSHAGTIDASNDLLISGGLEVNGSTAFDGFVIFGSGASFSNSLELTSVSSKLGINAGAFINTAFEVGGTASISGTTTLNGVTYTWPSADGAADNYVLTTNGSGVLTWEQDDTAAGGVNSNSLNFDEFQTNLVLDVDTTITGGAFALTFDHASVSGNFDIATKLGVISGGFTDTTFEVGGTASISGTTTLNGVTYTWPSADGGADNYVLTTDSAVTLTWELDDTSSGVASNSLGFGAIVNNPSLDANFNIKTDGYFFGLSRYGQAPSTLFEVQGTASASYLLTGNTLQVGGFSSAAYSRFGTGTTNHGLSAANDLFISGYLEVDSSASFDGGLEISSFASASLGTGNFSINLGGTGDFIVQDNGSTFFTLSDSGVLTIDSLTLDGSTIGTPSGDVTIDSAGNLVVTDAATFNGLMTISAGASSSTGFEITAGNLGINAGGETNTRFEVGGTASISGATTLNKVTYTWPSADGSDNYVLTTDSAGTLTWELDDTSSGVASNSIGFGAIVNNPSLDANFNIKTDGYFFGLSRYGQAPSTLFEVQGTASASYLLTGNTLQVGGFSSAAYSRFGTGTTNHGLSAANDLFISGYLEVDSSASFDGGLEISSFASASLGTGNFSINLGGTGDFIVQDNGSTFFTLSVSGVLTIDSLTLDGSTIGTPSGDVTIDSAGNLVVTDAATFNGLMTISAGASSSTGFEITAGNLGINAGGETNTRFEVGGTASISGATTLNKVTYTWPSADGSDNYVLTTDSAGTLTWELDDTSSGVASNSIGFGAIVNNPSLDANFNIKTDGYFFGLSRYGQAPSTLFEVQGTASASYLLTGNTLQVGGFSSAAYSRFGTGTTNHGLSAANDLFISGYLEVDSSASFDGGLEISSFASASLGTGNFSINLGGTGDFIVQDNGSTFFTLSVSGVLTIASLTLDGKDAGVG